MGISKRELLECYYMDEIGPLIEEWNRLHRPSEEPEETNPMTFFGEGGEWVE